MPDLACFPYASVQFTKHGDVHDPAELEAALRLAASGPTDVLTFVHGWNTDMVDAADLYRRLARVLCADPAAADRSHQFAVIGVLWPSKRFTEPARMPGGGASLGGPAADVEDAVARLRAQLDGTLDPTDLDEVTDLLRDVEDLGSARDRLVELVLARWPRDDLDPEELPTGFRDAPGGAALLALAARPSVADLGGVPRRDGTDVGAALGMFTGKGLAGAANLLNVFTYFTMRHRAGVVGARGVHAMLRAVRQRAPGVRLHLVGHSFGARLATAAVQGTGSHVGVATLCLLQAAFSQHAFAADVGGRSGLYRPVVAGGLVSGPILVTHTRNDRAVAIAYALASRIAGQVASLVGRRDEFAGLGAVGAHPGTTPEALDVDAPPDWSEVRLTAGRVNNLDGDAVIEGHSDIATPAVARAVWAAVGGDA